MALQIISRSDALTQGLNFFFTGKPCVRGHTCERRVNGGDCVKCSRVRQGLTEEIPPRTLARKEAIASGALIYHGKPCVKDPAHRTKRYATSGNCVECTNLAGAAAYQANPNKVKDALEKRFPDIADRRAYRAKDAREWRKRYPEKAKARDKKVNDARDKDQVNEYARNRRLTNPAAVHETDNAYQTKRRAENLNFKLAGNLRNRLNRAVQRGTKAGSAVRDLGCTIEEFRAYIERHFLPGMTWENWGVGPGKWHLDHVRELADFDLRVREEFLAAAHWSNYRPLWSEENCGRSARFGRGILGRSRQPQALELVL